VAPRRPTKGTLGLDPAIFPVDPWQLIETSFERDAPGHRETLFTLANGYLGMRSASPDGTHVHDRGTYLNGFHETWPIRYPEDAVGMARTGQTMVAVPDATGLELTVDGETFALGESAVTDYRRTLDMRSGQLRTEATWTIASGARIGVVWTRMVSMVERTIAVLTVELTSDVPIEATVRSTLAPPDSDAQTEPAGGEEHDPRQATQIAGGALQGVASHLSGSEMSSTFTTKLSGLEVSCAVRHQAEAMTLTASSNDDGVLVSEFHATLGTSPVKLTKVVSIHDTVQDPTPTLARCAASLDLVQAQGLDALAQAQRLHLDRFWETSGIVVEGNDADQQAIRWNLFALAQATSCADGRGISAKGVTSAGYDGHYFWDTEIYIVPFLTATQPELARPLLEFRYQLLDAARNRAKIMSEAGALFPWRTIMGAEASAFFLAGTAQYHINSAVGHGIDRYNRATGDDDYLACCGTEIMIEIARFWISLGFFVEGEQRSFHIHAVTGPDEYTALVNDNLYTNAMAQADLRFAAHAATRLQDQDPARYAELVAQLGLDAEEVASWRVAADAMHLPYDAEQGVHLQNEDFLSRPAWPWETTPDDKYPLLLNFHPLVIYRHQVLKQPDVVMAMYLRGEDFSTEQIERNFDFYEPLTTGDSSLSSCIQAVVAAKADRSQDAAHYLNDALYLDLCNAHGNSADGVHLASTGGVWAAVVHGYLGIEVHHDRLVARPSKPPASWSKLSTQIVHRGICVRIELSSTSCTLSTESASPVTVTSAGIDHELSSTSPLTISI